MSNLPNPLIRIERAMNTYKVTLEIDEKWLTALMNFTNDVYDGEVLNWLNVEKIGE